jgi:hypothetical protein
MKAIIIAVGLGVAGAAIAYLYFGEQRYYPVVSVEAPEALTYIAVQDPRNGRKACAEANERFLAPIKAGCKDCRLLAARCERSVQADEAKALSAGLDYLVVAPGLRMLIVGPDAIARRDCAAIAKDMLSRGLSGVACIFPKQRPT